MPRTGRWGWIRGLLATVPVAGADLTGVSQLDIVTGIVPGFQGEIESISYVATTAHTGAGGTLTFRLKKGTTIMAAITVPLATSDAKGEVTKAAIAFAETAKFSDSDALTFERQATGTVFATGAGTFYIYARQLPQARA
jgi:hypothetical protein